MRKILTIAFAVIGVLVVIAVVAPFLIPMDSYRGTLASAASRATGREVQISGPLRLSVYPELGLSASAVSVANIEGGRNAQMASVANLIVGVRLLPLLSGRVEVVRLILEQPVIHLEVAADGTPNWAFAANATPEEEPQNTTPGNSALESFGIENLTITDGLVSYYDAGTDTAASLEDVDVTLAMPSADAPLSLQGGLTYKARRLDVDANFAQPRAFLQAEGTGADVSIASDILNAEFAGMLAVSGSSTGTVRLDIPSLRDLAAWGGTPLPPGDNFGTADLESELTSEGTSLVFSRLRMTLDGMTITGELSLERGGDVPHLGGGLAIDRLDVNRYLTVQSAGAGASAEGAANGEPAPLQLGLLRSVDADMTLSVGTLLMQNLTFESAAMGVALDDGLLRTELREVSLYGGMGRGTLMVDAREDTPTFRQTLNVTATQIEPFFIDLMEMDRLSGTASITLDISSRGSTVDDIVNALSGSAQVNVANGALRGIDIASVARMLQNVVNATGLGEVTGDGAATEFTALGGTFRVENGIARNDDFRLLNPLIRVNGAGEINLAAQTMDFLLDPEPAPGGTVGGMALGSLGVPFRVHGPWTDLSYTPDMRGVAEGVLGGLGGLFGGDNAEGTAPERGGPANPLENAGNALRSLFGLGGR